MECNKEEAVKAMQLSVKKMQSKDYTGAMKMAQKAQRLFPELENISQLLTVCELHCTAENKIGGSEMDWYGILRTQQFDGDDTINKQYKKLALMLHPDKNKFAGSEAAFKWIVEAKSVLLDKQKRTIYDIKYRTLVKLGAPKIAAHPAATNSQKNPQQPQSETNTFWTQCKFCLSKFQYFRDFMNRMLRCQRCRRAFEACELQDGVPPETLRNNFPNRKEPPSQGPSNFVSPSDFGTEMKMFTGFQNRAAASKPASKVEKPADLSKACEADPKDIRHEVKLGNLGVETAKSIPVTSKEAGTSSDFTKEREKTTSELGEGLRKRNRATADSEHAINEKVKPSATMDKEREKTTSGPGEGLKTGNRAAADSEHVVKENVEFGAGHHSRRSSRNKNKLPSLYTDKDDNDDDFVSPPLKRLRKDELFSDSEKKENDAVDGNKKHTREKVHCPVEETLPNKNSKSGEFDLKVNGAAMSNNHQSNSKADPAPVPNVVDVSTPVASELPDPQFHKFVLDADSVLSLVKPSQIWAVFVPGDGMPKWYAYVKKVRTSGFKLEIIWLEPIPCHPGENDWCEEELPVTCGKFKLGSTDKIEDHLVLSHQIQYQKGRGRSSILIYPMKGETWAIYQNWDINWSSEPEKHLPYIYDFVEILTDYVEGVGVGVRYLVKVRGFVSLFQKTDQHRVISFQIPLHELYKFSHQIPSFKMTGYEGPGVPPGSFELDPASLPAIIFYSNDSSNLEVDDSSKKTETEGLCCENVCSVTGCSGLKQEEKKHSKSETLMSTSPRMSDTEFVDCMKGKSMTNLDRGNLTQPQNSDTPFQANKGNNTPKKQQKNNSDRATFSLRRSPRELSKNSTASKEAMKYPEPVEDENHVSFDQADTTSSQYSSRMQSTPKDQNSQIHMKNLVDTPSFSSSARRLSQAELYDFKGLKSPDKFSLGQLWALYNDVNGMPNTYAQVTRIKVRPSFQVFMTVLEPCSELKQVTGPVSCGTFKLKYHPTVVSLSKISHCLNTEEALAGKVFEIKPKKGEIWALLENHNPELAKGECELVEVLEDDGRSIKVGALVKLKGCKSIFKPPRIQRSKAGIIDVPQAELHRFSHRIPAIQHGGESNSRVFAGCWELDPLSIPGGLVVYLD